MERNARASLLLLPLLLAASGCIVSLGKLGEEETDTDPGTSGDDSVPLDVGGGESTGGTDDGPIEPPVPTERMVDILFVIDNSGSMSEEQAKLASSIESLVATFDSAAEPVDYRIGVTTTDNGNPWCGVTTPEAGQLRATSCRSRPQEFTFNGSVVIEGFDEACAALCPEDLETLTTTDGKPWIEVNGSIGTTNLGDAKVVESLRCILPQGIDGCGFEQPLEAAATSLARFETMTETAFGFHRPGALLAVMVVTDEVDCSFNPAWEEIFLPDGNRAFWSDPDTAAPSSAVCWNAGVACTDLGDGTLDCESEDYEVDGDLAAAPDDAVLFPIERYTAALAEAGAYVFAIYGVGLDGNVVYRAPTEDPQYGLDYGTAAGCESPSGNAVPPVRMREVVTTLGGTSASICDDGFQTALVAFGQGILARLPQ